MGNRLTKVHNGTPTNYTYDDAGQMTAAGGTSYTYDNNGNTATAGADTYTWDAENRLAGATIGGVTSAYTYIDDPSVQIAQMAYDQYESSN